MTTMTGTVNDEAIALIDEALRGTSRDLIPADEVQSTLLDLRNLLTGNDQPADTQTT